MWRRESSRASYLHVQIPDEGEGEGDRLFFSVAHSARIRNSGPKLKHRILLLDFLKHFCCESECTGWPESFCLHAQNPSGSSPKPPAHTTSLEWIRGQEVPVLQEGFWWALWCCLKQQ